MMSEDTAETSRSPDTTERALAACEILSLVSTLLLGAWAVAAISNDHFLLPIPVAAGLIYILLSMRIRGEGVRVLGFRMDNFVNACVPLLIAMALGSAVMVAIGWTLGSLRVALPAQRSYILLYPIAGVAWGLLQQFALQGFVNRRAQIIWGRGWRSCLLVAILFAVFHLPNTWLSVATFIGGLIWAPVYQRYPNLFALALSHAIMTFVLVTTMPESALQGLGVGFRLWTP